MGYILYVHHSKGSFGWWGHCHWWSVTISKASWGRGHGCSPCIDTHRLVRNLCKRSDGRLRTIIAIASGQLALRIGHGFFNETEIAPLTGKLRGGSSKYPCKCFKATVIRIICADSRFLFLNGGGERPNVGVFHMGRLKLGDTWKSHKASERHRC